MPGKPDAIYPTCGRPVHRLRRIGQALGGRNREREDQNARWISVRVGCRVNG